MSMKQYQESQTTLPRLVANPLRLVQKNRLFVGTLIFLSIARFLAGQAMPLTTGNAVNLQLDDFLMIQYSHLNSHFHPSSGWDMTWALVKPMSYSYLIAIANLLNIPYRVWFALLWIVSALAAVHGLRRFWTHLHPTVDSLSSQIFWILSYAFLLFSPAGFDATTAQRVYRESIIPPITMLLAGLTLTYLEKFLPQRSKNKPCLRQQYFWGFLLGVVWGVFWFIKESSVWLAPLLACMILVCICLQIRNIIVLWGSPALKKTYKAGMSFALAIACCVPLLVFASSSAAYHAVNRHFFGIPYASVRTEGEIAGFFKRLYQVEDTNRTATNWVPWSVMEKAIDASPTLRNHPGLIERIKTVPFSSDDDWETAPPTTDMGVWNMMLALQYSGLYDSQEEPQQLFKQINEELDAANLEQSSGFTPTQLLPKKKLSELPSLGSTLSSIIQTSVLWQHFESADSTTYVCDDTRQPQQCRLLETTLQTQIPKSTDSLDSFNEYTQRSYLKMATCVFQASKVLAPALLFLAIVGILLAFASCIKSWLHRSFNRSSAFALCVIGFSIASGTCIFALSLAVAWQYPVTDYINWQQLKYYTTAFVPLVQLIEITAIGFLIHYSKRNYRFRKDRITEDHA